MGRHTSVPCWATVPLRTTGGPAFEIPPRPGRAESGGRRVARARTGGGVVRGLAALGGLAAAALPLLSSTAGSVEAWRAGPVAAPVALDLAAGGLRDAARSTEVPRVEPFSRPSRVVPTDDVSALRKAVDLGKASPPAGPSAGSRRASESNSRATATGGQEFARPVTGRITSNFGPRWGTTHYGLDIANRIGTPIRSVGAGTVINAGRASGFGLWVRVRLEDGTITVYGHINRALVRTGQYVAAGELIAEVGNRGQSTGPHLHFEVISPNGGRMDPLAWLQRRGVGDVAS